MASDWHCLASVEKGSPNHAAVMVGRTETANSDGRGWGWECACSRVCARECMHACVRDVFAIYDHDILPMLIMIIINIIILYFIQIRHTDDFPSTGTCLVYLIGPNASSCINSLYRRPCTFMYNIDASCFKLQIINQSNPLAYLIMYTLITNWKD